MKSLLCLYLHPLSSVSSSSLLLSTCYYSFYCMLLPFLFCPLMLFPSLVYILLSYPSLSHLLSCLLYFCMSYLPLLLLFPPLYFLLFCMFPPFCILISFCASSPFPLSSFSVFTLQLYFLVFFSVPYSYTSSNSSTSFPGFTSLCPLSVHPLFSVFSFYSFSLTFSYSPHFFVISWLLFPLPTFLLYLLTPFLLPSPPPFISFSHRPNPFPHFHFCLILFPLCSNFLLCPQISSSPSLALTPLPPPLISLFISYLHNLVSCTRVLLLHPLTSTSPVPLPFFLFYTFFLLYFLAWRWPCNTVTNKQL